MFDFNEAVVESKPQQYTMPVIQTNESVIEYFYSALNSGDINNLKEYVRTKVFDILSMCVNDKNPKALQIILNDAFLNQLYILISEGLIDLSKDDYKLMLNRICYDYSQLTDRNIFIQNKMIDIVYHLNKSIVTMLQGFNLTKEQACLIAIARYSTAPQVRTNFKRVTREIQKMTVDVMTEQTIVNIYGKICNEPVSELFISIMQDSYDSFISDEQSYIYSTVSLAILDIIESLPTDHINKVLSAYLLEKPSNKPPRFNLKSISVGDYPRINDVIDMLEVSGHSIF